jgi:hypothetical protein
MRFKDISLLKLAYSYNSKTDNVGRHKYMERTSVISEKEGL